MASTEEMKQLLGRPVYLAPNTYLHFYNGGKLRAAFMREPDPKDDFNSEEWIFSTNRAITPGRDNPPDKGFSKVALPSGEIILLQDLLKAFPNETLGEKHFAKFGPNLGILAKIFDVGDGAHIPVHWHPSPEFATKHLDSPNGKNEAWVVIGTRPGAKAWIGWKHDVDVNDFRQWMDAQDVETMRSHMHEVSPKTGDVIFRATASSTRSAAGCASSSRRSRPTGTSWLSGRGSPTTARAARAGWAGMWRWRRRTSRPCRPTT